MLYTGCNIYHQMWSCCFSSRTLNEKYSLPHHKHLRRVKSSTDSGMNIFTCYNSGTQSCLLHVIPVVSYMQYSSGFLCGWFLCEIIHHWRLHFDLKLSFCRKCFLSASRMLRHDPICWLFSSRGIFPSTPVHIF